MITLIINSMQNIKEQIEDLSKIHHIEILRIFKKYPNITLNENKNGIFFNVSLLDDELQFKSKIHHRDDTWYDKDLGVVENDFIEFLKETQKETYDTLQKKYGENTNKNILKRLHNSL